MFVLSLGEQVTSTCLLTARLDEQVPARPRNADPLLGMSQLAADELQAARDAIDEVLWRRDVRAAATQVAADSLARGARDSAAIDGADVPAADDSPMGHVLANTQALTLAAAQCADVFAVAPLQALANLHAVAAQGFVDPAQRGRPRTDDTPDDPLLIGSIPPAGVVPARLTQLASVVATTQAPALLQAAIVHGELMTLRPFAWGSGLVARALVRTVLVAKGVDPSCFTIPELGMFAQGRGAYVAAIRSFALGDPQSMVAYLQWFALSCVMGAQAVLVP